MKMLLIALFAITSTSVFAASREVVKCSDKYEKFTISVDELDNVTIEKGTWERENGVFATRKVQVHAKELKIHPNGLQFTVEARESSKVKITMDKVANNENNVLELNLKVGNQSTLRVLNESLGIDSNGVSFFADECIF